MNIDMIKEVRDLVADKDRSFWMGAWHEEAAWCDTECEDTNRENRISIYAPECGTAARSWPQARQGGVLVIS